MQPQFKIGNSESLHITEQYLCNGHWLIDRKAIPSFNFKPLKKVENLAYGSYSMGLGAGKTNECKVNFAQIIPERSKYVPMSSSPVRVEFRGPDSDEIMAYVYSFGGQEIGISPKYVPLLRLGFCFARDNLSPVIVLNDSKIDSNLIGVVMPVRINHTVKKIAGSAQV